VDRNIILGVQASDIYEISKSTKLKIYVQHGGYYEPGRNTGYILPEAVKKRWSYWNFFKIIQSIKLSYDYT